MGEMLACSLQGRIVQTVTTAQMPLEFHINTKRVLEQKVFLGDVGRMLLVDDIVIRLHD